MVIYVPYRDESEFLKQCYPIEHWKSDIKALKIEIRLKSAISQML
jgi:hypothetical protein